ncbi:MAG TPA: hypothetical protein VFG76_05800 [Candidatus Polarisedimenticolia bacterium]|nr:hypothetical protein [Candidatus Polarisedimenticolia bacterium]
MASILALVLSAALGFASASVGLLGYEGQPGNQGGHGGNGLKGYEGQPGNQGGH